MSRVVNVVIFYLLFFLLQEKTLAVPELSYGEGV